MFAWPVWGKGYVMLVCMRFSRTLAMLMHGGVSLIDSVRLAGKATGSCWVNSLVDEQVDAVREAKGPGDLKALLAQGETWTIE